MTGGHRALIGMVAVVAWIAWSCTATVDLPETGSPSASGAGGAGGSDSGATGGSAPMPCETPADCPGEEGECATRTCVDEICGQHFLPEGTVIDSQQAGDCLEVRCNGVGNTETLEIDDVYDDGQECTQDLCQDGAPVHPPHPSTMLCASGAKFCNGMGACVDCLEESHCDSVPACAGGVCACNQTYFQCELKTCQNLVSDPGETDLDCGGPDCAPCTVGEICAVGTDCDSFVCGSSLLCMAPTCLDVVKNGDETDSDCGGTTCDPCPDGGACISPTDCDSGVCTTNVCAVPACNDGVENGDESDKDCGGSKCGKCGKGKKCRNGSDCLNTLVCQQGKCELRQMMASLPMQP